MTLPKAIILEIDGILADDSHRRHFINFSLASEHMNWLSEAQNWEPDYESYYDAMDKDTVNDWCADLLWHMNIEEKPFIIFITVRPEKYREKTIEWFGKSHWSVGFRKKQLFMRPDFEYRGNKQDQEGNFSIETYESDNRPSHIVKREIYDLEIKDKYDILFVLERSGLDADMYRELGLSVLEVR